MALNDVSRMLELPPDERLANLDRYTRCVTVRFQRRAPNQEELDLRRLMPDCLARSSTVWEYTSCAICLTDFADGEELRRTPCSGGHAFHPKCLRGWLERSHTTCPVCRGGDEREHRGRPPGKHSAEVLAEYVLRRVRGGKTDFTVSEVNKKKAEEVTRHMRDAVPPVQEDGEEVDEDEEEDEAGATQKGAGNPGFLADIFRAKMAARAAETAPQL